MTNDISVEEALKKLQDLENRLQELDRRKDSGKINLFTAAGLTTQEVKHSAFLGWLLDKSKPHNLQNAFLRKLVERLVTHKNDVDKSVGQKTNAEILADADINCVEDLNDFLDSEYKVFTELTTSDGTGRMDIVVQSESTKTVLVIENKTFTTTHDCQLSKYEEHYINTDYRRKIFVFLTPNNDLPIDIDDETHQYRPNWCVFDYREILAIVKELIPKATTQNNVKLKMIMEDYIDMVNDFILNNNQKIRSECKRIRKQYSEALDILFSYTDNIETVLKYIANKWLPQNIHNYCNLTAIGRRLVFFTDIIKNFYDKNGLSIELGNGLFKFQFSIISKDGPVSMDMWLSKFEEDEWSVADLKIHDILLPDKKMGKKFCTLYSCPLLSVEEREKVFEDDKELYDLIDKRLNNFLNKLSELENQLSMF